MKYVHYVVGVVLISFAALQWNDPDPWIWILMYLATAMTPILYGLKSLPRWMPLTLTLVLLIAFGLSMPAVIDWAKDGCPSIYDSMKAETPYVETVREALGIAICLLCSGVYSWILSRT